MDKRKLLLVVLGLVTAAALIFVAAYFFLIYLDSAGNNEQEEQWSEITKNVTTEDEESPAVTETVTVGDGSAAGELYGALKAAVSGTDTDMAGIIDGFSKSADMGNSDAMYFLGEIYFQGIGVGQDFEKAGEYLKKACESGNKSAMSIYGKMLFMGDGVPQNYDESAMYFYTLAEDDGEASYILGVMSNLGMGVPRSAKRAEKYIANAESLGYEKAGGYRSKIYNDGKVMEGTDGFKLAGKKVSKLSYNKTEYDDLDDLADKYRSILKDTESYAAFDSEMAGLLNVDMGAVSSVTLFGNNGYLFHQNENDGSPLHDYLGDNHFSKDELGAIAKNLEGVKKKVEGKDAKFVVMIIPNKEIVYAEYMPSYIKRDDTVTKADLLVEYLRANTDIDVVYVKDSLLAGKDKFPVYYKTDTHTNMVGSLFAVADLFKTCYGKEMTPDIEKFDIHMPNYMGDLGKMAKCTDRYSIDKVYFYPKKAVGDGDKIDSSIMLVGDSFSDFISMEMDYYLKGGVDYKMIGDYNFDYHAATDAGLESLKSKYVVWECVERYLYRLKK